MLCLAFLAGSWKDLLQAKSVFPAPYFTIPLSAPAVTLHVLFDILQYHHTNPFFYIKK